MELLVAIVLAACIFTAIGYMAIATGREISRRRKAHRNHQASKDLRS